MKFSFKAKIYKVGINPCVKVPPAITSKMVAKRGYIPIRGKVEGQEFTQTLVPVGNAEYRLYVNGPMLSGTNAKVGDTLRFSIDQDTAPRTVARLMATEFRTLLTDNNLLAEFKKLTSSRQKEILKYLNYLKTDEARIRNMNNIIGQLQRKAK